MKKIVLVFDGDYDDVLAVTAISTKQVCDQSITNITHSVFQIESGTIYEVNKKGVEKVTHFTEIK